MTRCAGVVLFVLVVGLAGSAGGQWPDRLKRAIGDAANTLSLDRLLDQQPLTTTLADAYPDVPFLDTHEPEGFGPITALRATPAGWQLRPGTWAYISQSYCLRAGTQAPSRGRGYVAAPLKGPQADIIRAILRNSARESDIPQRDIQVLLWRIIARARFDQLPARQKVVAERLLTPAQIARLSAVRLDVLPGSPLNQALKNAPPEVRRVLAAEAEMRRVMASGDASYEQLERLAVLPGEPDARDDRLVPGRWTYNPAGYFVRYAPRGYSTTTVQVDVPDPIVIQADALGRIISLADPDGRRRLRLNYDERPGDVCPTDKDVRAELVRSVWFETAGGTAAQGGRQSKEWRDQAVILTGVPTSRREPSAPLAFQYNEARKYAQQTDEVLSRTARGRADRQRLTNLVHLAIALDSLLAENGDEPAWTIAQRDLVFDAWQYEICRAAGACAAPAVTSSTRGDWAWHPFGPTVVRAAWRPGATRGMRVGANGFGSSGQAGGASSDDVGGTLDAGDSVAQPGTDGQQRLGQSSRQQEGSSFAEWLKTFVSPRSIREAELGLPLTPPPERTAWDKKLDIFSTKSIRELEMGLPPGSSDRSALEMWWDDFVGTRSVRDAETRLPPRPPKEPTALEKWLDGFVAPRSVREAEAEIDAHRRMAGVDASVVHGASVSRGNCQGASGCWQGK